MGSREERQAFAACRGLRSEAEQGRVWEVVEPWGGSVSLEGEARVPVLGAPSTLLEPGEGGRKPAGPFLFTVVGKVLFLVFCCFVFGFAVCFLRGKEVCNYFVQSSHYMSGKEEIL